MTIVVFFFFSVLLDVLLQPVPELFLCSNFLMCFAGGIVRVLMSKSIVTSMFFLRLSLSA